MVFVHFVSAISGLWNDLGDEIYDEHEFSSCV